MIEGLVAGGPDPDLKEKLMLFGQFVGDWDIDRWWIEPDGKEGRNTGRVHFGWILEGLAVQDVWSSLEGDPPTERAVGTTIRFYDPGTDAWTCVWVAPAYSLARTFSARKVGEEIVLEGTNSEGNIEHWVYSDVRPASFMWRALESGDGGKTWRLTEEMRVRRKEPTAAAHA